MSKFRKMPAIIDAVQWFKNGDHPEDNCYYIDDKSPNRYLSEGEIVRYFRRPDVSGISLCSICRSLFHGHGWIDTLEGGHIVCPGDWIITGVKGEHYPCKPDIFEATYKEASIKEQDKERDNIFIKHIKSHLAEDEYVICKVCGRKAEEIIQEVLDAETGNS